MDQLVMAYASPSRHVSFRRFETPHFWGYGYMLYKPAIKNTKIIICRPIIVRNGSPYGTFFRQPLLCGRKRL